MFGVGVGAFSSHDRVVELLPLTNVLVPPLRLKVSVGLTGAATVTVAVSLVVPPIPVAITR